MKTQITTSDIYFAAALLSLGHKIESVDKTDPRHMEFTIVTKDGFESPNLPVKWNMDELEVLWANEQLMINAVQFKNAIQRMKSMIHSK